MPMAAGYSAPGSRAFAYGFLSVVLVVPRAEGLSEERIGFCSP
jgi:hypothetical protein